MPGSNGEMFEAVGAPVAAPVLAPRRPWLPLVIWLGILLSPLIALVAVAVVVLGAMVVTAPFAYLDERLNSNTLEPGRWESDGGEYWVELLPDGTGSFRLPHQDYSNPNLSFPYDDDELTDVVVEATWTFDSRGSGTYGDLDVAAERDAADPNVSWGPFLTGGGWWGGGYDWDTLNYSIGDPDSVDITLHKVDDY